MELRQRPVQRGTTRALAAINSARIATMAGYRLEHFSGLCGWSARRASRHISLSAVDNQGTPDRTVCDVLAITSDERASLESLIQKTETEYLDWMRTHVQRIEPSGNIVAQYLIPANPPLAQRLILAGTMGVLGAVGLERTELARNYASHWMEKRGFLGQMPVSLTVRRSVGPDGQQRFEAKCDTVLSRGSSSTGYADLTPDSFPDVFRAIFPGGWHDLAQREDFELPSDFQEAPPAQ